MTDLTLLAPIRVSVQGKPKIMDRLTGAMVNEVDASGTATALVADLTYLYDGDVGSSTAGDLIQRTDIGKFNYSPSHAPSDAFGDTPGATAPAAINQGTQAISYTTFLKAATISEEIGSDAYQLTYTYGTDHQRAKSELKKNGNGIETRIYCGAYEEQRLPGTTNKIHYVTGPSGLCAMIVQADGVETIYYVYKDHLGSIVTLTTEQGGVATIAAQQNFDPWGRRRNPTDWTYENIPGQPDWLYRGYTGHEHVEPFALVNMNGRMYDPLNGRMLSADNYVQEFLGTQGFNRYSYAGNNPLKYTDPSGENPLLIVLATAFIGGYVGGAIAAGQGGLSGADWNPFGGRDGHWSGEWWKGAITGALVGATLGYGAVSVFGGAATQAALATKLGTALGLSAKKVAISSISNLITTVASNKNRGWNVWSSLVAAAATPFISDLSFITGNNELSASAFTEMTANAAYGFVDRYTAPTITTIPQWSRIGYSLIGAIEGAGSLIIYGGLLSEAGVDLKSASLLFHGTTSLPGLNESLLRGAISPLTLFGTIPFDRWYISQTNRYERPWDIDKVLQWMLTK